MPEKERFHEKAKDSKNPMDSNNYGPELTREHLKLSYLREDDVLRTASEYEKRGEYSKAANILHDYGNTIADNEANLARRARLANEAIRLYERAGIKSVKSVEKQQAVKKPTGINQSKQAYRLTDTQLVETLKSAPKRHILKDLIGRLFGRVSYEEFKEHETQYRTALQRYKIFSNIAEMRCLTADAEKMKHYIDDNNLKGEQVMQYLDMRIKEGDPELFATFPAIKEQKARKRIENRTMTKTEYVEYLNQAEERMKESEEAMLDIMAIFPVAGTRDLENAANDWNSNRNNRINKRHLEGTLAAYIIGMGGLLLSILFSTSSWTGNVIGSSLSYNWMGAACFLVGIIGAFWYFRN